jgi:hypothetical protein
MAIKIPIFADYDNKGVNEAESAFQNFGKKVGDIAKTAALAFAAVGTAAAVGAFKAVQKASDLAESVSKIETIFGDSAQGVSDFSKTAAKELGLSKQAVYDAAGTFGVFGKAAGLGGQDLADFSTDFTVLAADLASFNNTTPEDAISAIGSALRGESEPLRRYGVMLDDAALKAEAMAQGIYDGKGPLTQQQKVLAATGAIFKQTGDAQGDFAKTSGGLANQQRIFKAQLDNVVTTIGTKLLPVFMTIVNFISDKVIPVVELLTEAFEKDGLAGIIDVVKEQLPKLKEVLGNAMSMFWEWIKDAVPPALKALLDMLYDLGQWLQNTGLPALGKALEKGAKELWKWIEKAAPPALKRLGELMGDLANWLLDEGLPMMVDKLIELGDALVEWIKPQIVPALEALGDFLLDILEWIITEAVPKLGEQALELGEAMLEWIEDLLPEAAEGLGKFILDLVKKLPGLFVDLVEEMADLGTDLGGSLIDALVEALKGLATGGLNIGKDFANAIIGFINVEVIQKLNSLLDFQIGLPFGKKFDVNPPDLPDIPELAQGGIVTGPTLAMIGEGNGPEAVIPLSKLGQFGFGGGGANITVNVNGGDPNQIVAALRRYISTNGTLPLAVR